ncbi:single-stranded DNA-binding protein [Parabacteroides distasonis]|uniref:single-stranded DNA-binding protein n=1 Tax=Parabacteroides distasonis TaxID=823 RepID=UPI0012B17CB8|nr:single-stranded DNA-binding protein [Parabacteroides distasonis]MRY42825.1 single-stranded DNA-binding protein [Parabacteroides distasonis]
MNKLIINGNLVRDIDLQFTPGTGNAVLRNTIASRRKFKNKNTDQYESDFISFTAFGKSAEFIANNFVKGQGIQLECRIQSGSYENDGVKYYTQEAIVESIEFWGSKGKGNSENNEYSASANNAFSGGEFEEEITPVNDGDMPF